MSNLVIVAIPAESDRVWKISSEKAPHLTLLFLGDAESNPNLEQIMLFVDHATTMSEHGPFYLDVDRRDTLGEDEADVLFFSKRSWNLKWIKQFRSQLLQNQAIKSAYDSVEQFPEWQPHLTLGYPETPAKTLSEDGFDHPIYSVEFDRIAVWTGDFEGPDFRLEWPERQDDSPYAVAMSSVHQTTRKPSLDEALEHFGVNQALVSANDTRKAAGLATIEHFGTKGMRWGQRKDTQITVNGKTKQVTAKKAAKLDASWEKNQYTLPKAVERHNAMAEYSNARLGPLNDKYKDHDFTHEWEKDPKDWSPTMKSYMKEFGDLETEGYHHAVAQELPSPTGKKKTVLETKGDQLSVVIKSVDAKHAVTVEDDDEVFVFKITRDAKGLITDTTPVENAMSQTVELGIEFLKHHGTKGMKWGVRKDRATGAAKTGAKAVGRGAKAAVRFGQDVQFENMAADGRARQMVVKHAYKNFKAKDIPKINAKPEYQAAKKLKTRLRNPRDPIVKQYRKEHREAYIKQLEKSANAHTNASGTRQYTIRERGIDLPAKGGALPKSKYFWDVSTRPTGTAAHAADSFPSTTTLEVIMDADGFITDLKQQPAEATHAADLGVDFLEHIGVKGMRWGIRKRRELPSAVAPMATSRVPHGAKRKTKVEVEGGENHPAHEDAIKVAESKAKLKKSGASALSNQELREVANRVQLENQVSLLTSSKGKQFVAKQFESESKNLAKAGIREGVKKGVKKVGKSAATAAVVAA